MPELHDGPMVEIAPWSKVHLHPKIAVAVCSSPSGAYALRWALEKEVPAQGLVYLMHVHSPIRWIPNALGGRFSVDQAHPDTVQRFKNQRDLDAEKMINKYRHTCDRKKIKSEVCYSESDSVQKELVHQISKLGISKLIVGTSRGAFARALGKESVSTYVAKHAPGFCEVFVVNKEKLCHFKRGTQAPALVSSSSNSTSEASVSVMGSDEDDPRTSSDLGSGDRRTWSGGTEDIRGSSLGAVAMEISEESTQYPDSDTLSQTGAVSTIATPPTQRPSPAHENDRLSSSASIPNGSVVEHERCWLEASGKTQKELETQKRMADAHAIEVALVKQQLEAERRRCKETILKLEDLSRRLEIECRLRIEAEEKASLEAVAKLDALASLRRERQRYAEYSYEELQAATNGFHEENKLGVGGYGPVYRGKLRHTPVAIKVLARDRSRGREEFQREVELLSRIRHPHMLMLLGACPEKGCIVYEYMANGSLEDRLNCKDGTPPLPWYARFRICFEVATALLFFHSQPQPIVHRDLKPGNILLDHHFVSKIGDVGLAKLVPKDLTFNGVTMYRDTIPVGTFAYIDPDYQRTGVVSCESDVYALGMVMLQLLTGKPAVGITHLVETAHEAGKLGEVLDKSAGDWSLEEAGKLACISLKCTEFKRRDRPRLEMDILPVLESIQNVAESAAANMASLRPSSSRTRPTIPSFFFCPISQEIMEAPCMAADGFTYENHAISAWLQANNTSPMTNLRLEHKNLTPNYTLRGAIREWHDNGLI